jgi:hypothetical protein
VQPDDITRAALRADAPGDALHTIHEALIDGCQAELALACDPRVPDGIALVVLPHGTPEAQVAFGPRASVARELAAIAAEEGPAALGLEQAGAALLQRGPSGEGKLLCVVVALGRARIHEIPWPRVEPPATQA